MRASNEITKHFVGDNVDVIIYALEKSLDSYKFNLLHCKQIFITQLKGGAMGQEPLMRCYGLGIRHKFLGIYGNPFG